MLHTQRSDRQNAETILIDKKRIFVRAVRRATIFHDAHAAGRNLVGHAMIEQDDAVGDVFLQAAAGKGPASTLSGDNRGYAFVFQPAEEAAQLGAENAFVLQSGKEGLDGVEHHTLGADRFDGGIQADEQPFEIVLASFFNLVSLDADEIENQFLLADELVEVEAERADVLRQLLRALFESHEYARFVIFGGAAYQELHGQQGLPATRASADERRPASRKAPLGDLIETLDTGRSFREFAIRRVVVIQRGLRHFGSETLATASLYDSRLGRGRAQLSPVCHVEEELLLRSVPRLQIQAFMYLLVGYGVRLRQISQSEDRKRSGRFGAGQFRRDRCDGSAVTRPAIGDTGHLAASWAEA